MISYTLPVLSFVALSVAQSSTVNLFIPFADEQSLVGSIAGSDSTATTFVVNCPSRSTSATTAATTGDSSDDIENECGFTEPFTITQGPSTAHYVMTIGDAGVETFDCKLMGTTEAICAATASGSELLEPSNSIPPLTTATLSGSDVVFLPVVITAGSATPKQTSGASAKTTATGSTSAKAGSATGTSSSAVAKSTNAAMQGAPVFGAGVLGALGVAVAGAML